MASMRLTGSELWVQAGLQGEVVWIRKWGDKDWWWPLVMVDLDTGLIKIDVCGKLDNLHLDDVAQMRLGDSEYIDNEDFLNKTTKVTEENGTSSR